MKLARLIYRSIAVADVVSNETLRDIERQASQNNANDRITGLLVLSGNVFAQVLEGDVQAVTTLFGRIVADKRHRRVELITVQPVVKQLFEDWAMRLVDLYDLPGEQRAFMAAKYRAENGSIVVPEDLNELHAFLLDARYLCSGSPWNATSNPDAPAQSA